MNGYNFTERVRKVLAMAREEAARLHHEYVGTEHILLGLIREGEGVAAAVLQNLSVDLDEIQQKIEETVKKGKAAQATGPDLPYTSRAKKVLELAMAEARELNHSYVGTEHLLLGLLREEKGIAAQVLTDTGVNRIPLTNQLAFDVKVQNQGQSEETDVGVSLTIQNSKKIAVLGQVAHPGQVGYYPNMTIVDAIAAGHGEDLVPIGIACAVVFAVESDGVSDREAAAIGHAKSVRAAEHLSGEAPCRGTGNTDHRDHDVRRLRDAPARQHHDAEQADGANHETAEQVERAKGGVDVRRAPRTVCQRQRRNRRQQARECGGGLSTERAKRCSGDLGHHPTRREREPHVGGPRPSGEHPRTEPAGDRDKADNSGRRRDRPSVARKTTRDDAGGQRQTRHRRGHRGRHEQKKPKAGRAPQIGRTDRAPIRSAEPRAYRCPHVGKR